MNNIKNKKGIILLLGILTIIIFSFFLLHKSSSIITYFNDKNLGLIKITSEKSLLPQIEQSFFTTSHITLGKTAKITTSLDPFSNCNLYRINTAHVIVSKNDVQVSDINIIYNIPTATNGGRCGVSQVTVDFTPPSTGVYSVKSVLTYYKYVAGWFCVNSEKASKAGNEYYCPNYGTKVVDGVTICSNNKCAVSSKMETATINIESKLTVDPVSSPCSKRPYFGEWAKVNDISGGRIDDRNFYIVDSACNYKVSSTESRIVCLNGYFVMVGDSLTSNTVATFTGSQRCEQNIYNPLPTIPIETACNDDLTIECDDGTSVITDMCGNGILIPTGNTCLAIVTPPSSGCSQDEIKTCSDGTTITLSKCVNGILIPTSEKCSDESFIEPPSPDWFFIIGWSIAIIIFILSIFLVIKFVIKRK